MQQAISRHHLTTLLFSIFTLFAGVSPVCAQVLAPEIAAVEAAPEYRWGLGLGAGFTKSPYRQSANKTTALPLILYENRWISVFGANFDVKLPAAGPVSFRLRARYAGDGYEADDSPYLAGMAERKGGVWLGGATIWRNSVVNVSAEGLAATRDAKGRRFKLEISHEFPIGVITLTPRVSANWYDKKYVDYYYGVRVNEVRTDRSYYTGESSNVIETGVRFSYGLNRHHRVFVDFSATYFGNAIRNSPLIENAGERSVRVGYLYAF